MTSHGSFWNSLGGILTGVAAVITAVATLIGVVYQLGQSEEPVPPSKSRYTSLPSDLDAIIESPSPKTDGRIGAAITSQSTSSPVSFPGFSCAVNSYGGSWAAQARLKIQDDLYQRYGCSIHPDAHMKPGCSSGYHAAARPEGPWRGFAWKSAVIYYSNASQRPAELLAADLSRRYNHDFITIRGGGQCIEPTWYNRTIIVHVRDTSD